jgi:cephalosporin-C deacetylase-like acetyl esterase
MLELNRTPTQLRATEVERRGHLVHSRLEFTSFGGVTITAYSIGSPGPRPLITHAHGYGSRCEPRWDWAAAGVNVVGVDIRGHGESAAAVPQPARGGYVLTGISSPETSVLRGAVCDYARTVELATQLFPDAIRTVLTGVSFAGGLALMSESLLHAADVLMVGVPTFGWAEGRHFLVEKGSGAQVNDYLFERPDLSYDTSLVLSYFDSMLFAPDVTCPAIVGIGMRDPVVPPATVYAIVRHLGGPHEVMEFPVSHTDLPEERLWQAFDRRCIEVAHDGLDADFPRLTQ